jgi:hypothetical protein
MRHVHGRASDRASLSRHLWCRTARRIFHTDPAAVLTGREQPSLRVMRRRCSFLNSSR